MADQTTEEWLPIEEAAPSLREIIGAVFRPGATKPAEVSMTWWWAPSSRTQEWQRPTKNGPRAWKPTHWIPMPRAPQ